MATTIYQWIGVCLFFLCLPLDAGSLYQWVDEDGITHFSQDAPAKQQAAGEVKQRHFTVERDLPLHQRQSYRETDTHALNVGNYTGSLEELAEVLVKPFHSELEKTRVLYRWVTHHIFYDAKGLLVRGRLGAQDAHSVLQSKTAVCEGYARLFEALAKAAGLEVETIVGYSKGYGDIPGERFGEKSTGAATYTVNGRTFSGTEVKHAWNAINIGGSWHLLDTTWGAGYIHNKRYRRQFNPYYFLTPPQQFIYDHFPDDERWQLLPNPLTLRDYEDLVTLGPAFFHHRLEILSHPDGVIHAGNRVRVRFGIPEDVQLLAQLQSLSDGNLKTLPDYFSGLQRNEKEVSVEAVFPAAGKYLLRLFAGKDKDKGRLFNAVNYTIKVARGMDMENVPVFPEQDFYRAKLRLYDTTNYFLNNNGNQIIRLLGPEQTKLTATVSKAGKLLGQDYIFIQSRDGLHEIRLTFPQTGNYAVQIFAKTGTEKGNELPLVLRYAVKAHQADGAVFPGLYRSFRSHRAYLYTPLQKRLHRGERQAFDLSVAEAEEVVVGTQQAWFPLQAQGKGRFSGNIKIPHGKFLVYARFPDSDGKYAGLAEYYGF